MAKRHQAPVLKACWRLVLHSGAFALVLGCQAQNPKTSVPAWPEEPALEVPDAPAPAAAGATDPAPAATSSSPLAPRYQGRAPVQELTGSATYYADSLAGNKTASGEVYRPGAFTAAHKTLPFGTVLRVTRRDAPRLTYVTVNDRGPFAGPERIIDLSRAAAQELEMLRAGVVPVKIEVLELPEAH